jgi:hypothetical protein
LTVSAGLLTCQHLPFNQFEPPVHSVAAIEKVGTSFLVLSVPAFLMIETQDRWKGDKALDDKKEWVDFKAVKAAVTIEMVLDHYGVTNLKRVGGELRGPCPIHRGTKSSKHLSVNPAKGAFRCFASSCGARGNVLDFVAVMETCSVRDAALKLADWFKVGESQPAPDTSNALEEEAEPVGLFPLRGIYKGEHDEAFEVIAIASTPESDEVVVCRDLFGDFLYWVLPVEDFNEGKDTFTLIKAF